VFLLVELFYVLVCVLLVVFVFISVCFFYCLCFKCTDHSVPKNLREISSLETRLAFLYANDEEFQLKIAQPPASKHGGHYKSYQVQQDPNLEEEALKEFKGEVESVTKAEIDIVWMGREPDATINLRRLCRKSGFAPALQIIMNRRYVDFATSFEYYSQRLRIVGMSYQRTIFARAFLNNGDVDEDYVKTAFANTHRWLFDDSFYFLLRNNVFHSDRTLKKAMLKANDGIVGKKVLFFMDEIIENLNGDLTLTKFQKDLFLYYFEIHHMRVRGCFAILYSAFYWSLFIFLVCLFFSFDSIFEGIYKYLLTPIGWDFLERHMESVIGEYAHVVAIFLVFFIVMLILLIILKFSVRCWKSFRVISRRSRYTK
jgi:hypothetical protein